MSLRLVSLDGCADIPLERAVVVVGRHVWCDARIASSLVSRRHCCLATSPEGILVRDLGSTNGTRINGQRVEHGVLRPGDELSIARCRYHLEGPRSLSASRFDSASIGHRQARSRDDL
jgi:pSer/pThr/pTyr-binding forkhead associated (FHA) protein